MKQRLEQLTIGQFIDLVCGEADVLLDRREIATPEKLADAARHIIFEYREISDKAEALSYLANVDSLTKSKMRVSIFTLCLDIYNLGKLDIVRDILAHYGVNAERMSKERLRAEVISQLERAKHTARRIEESESGKGDASLTPDDIRRSFDEQTAALMAYFKFQVDTSTMKATLYAHLVARHARELKAQRAAMKKK